ncbi:cell morphogenesis N-terminal-domain-containing protein [Dipodascopsis tothii]|uniref:cell morphogenesis N-terminal-domain-containing protein n=1 Tax=Dipodascopsis tothii TaxID=44089 RepID=UPI0034CD14D4
MHRQLSFTRPHLPRSFSYLARTPSHRSPSHGLHRNASVNSHASPSDPITPAEYALHIVFTQFVRHAEKKLNLCLANAADGQEPHIVAVLAHGVDPAFDKILSSLGYIARQKPRPVIDSVMFWRKSKSEAATNAVTALSHSSSRYRSSRRQADSAETYSEQAVTAAKESAVQAERKSLISIYILCRVLIEVVKQTTVETLGEEMGDKLEEIVFRQIKTADYTLVSTSSTRAANWNLFAELLGEMSNIRFATVSRRFIAELDRPARDATLSKEAETNTQLLIYGMRYLKLKVYPMDALDSSAEFLESIANYFVLSQGQTVKQAFSEILEQLLLPIAGVVTAEVNQPTWSKAVEKCFPKAMSMATRTRNWQASFSLACILLCVAPQPYFSTYWLDLVANNYSKLKDKAGRVVIITGITRLVWVYLRRCSESLNKSTLNVGSIVRTLFAPGRKTWLSSDPAVVSPCVQLARFVGHFNLDYCMTDVIFGLLNQDALEHAGVASLTLDMLSPERMIIGIKAFVYIFSDIEKGRAPPFYPPSEPARAAPYAAAPADDFFDPAYVEAAGTDDVVDVIAPPKAPALQSYYSLFSTLLGKIALLCYQHFGNRTGLEDKAEPFRDGLDAYGLPRSPMAFSFIASGANAINKYKSSGEPGLTAAEAHIQKNQAHYDLLLAVYEALPRCVPASISFTKVVEMLCKGSAHADERVRQAASRALKSLARTKNPQVIVTSFARFIFNFDEKFLNSTDNLVTDVTHLENTLKVYVELLTIWIDSIRRKSAELREAAADGAGNTTVSSDDDTHANSVQTNRSDELEVATILSVIEEVESNGLFFLCSQNRVLRTYGIEILKLIKAFDTALEEHATVINTALQTHARNYSRQLRETTPMTRIIDVLDAPDGCGILDGGRRPDGLDIGELSPAEKAQLERLRERKVPSGLLHVVAVSDHGVDTALWFRVFPRFVSACCKLFPMPVALCRDTVCGKLVQMQKALQHLSDTYHKFAVHEGFNKHSMRTQPEVFIEQWKLYLIVACCTMTATDDKDAAAVVPWAPAGGGRSLSLGGKKKAPAAAKAPAKAARRISSAQALFKMVLPFLQVDYGLVREAAVVGLGCINVNLYRTLIDSLQPLIKGLVDDTAKSRPAHQRSNSTVSALAAQPMSLMSRRNRRQDFLRTEITHVLQLSSHFLQDAPACDHGVIEQLVAFVKYMKNFLAQVDVQVDWEYQKIRAYFCGLIQGVFEGIGKTGAPARFMPFEGRVSCFRLIEEWCGHGQYAALTRERDKRMMQFALEQCRDEAEQGILIASVELERRNLELAALSAMASLLRGPITQAIEGSGQHAVMTFDVAGIFTWINAVFSTPSDKIHDIGRRAVTNLLETNSQHEQLLQKMVSYCYSDHAEPKAAHSYFWVVANLLVDVADYKCYMRQPVALGLFKIGDEAAEVRVQAARLLKAMEERFFGSSRVQDYEISIADRTPAVYKRAQFNLSNQFAVEHPELTYQIFSELTMFFNVVSPRARQDILSIMIPWVSTIELQLDVNGKDPSPSAYMVLTNLFEITVRFSSKIQNEVEALWVTLARSRHQGNVKAILDFVINTSVERKSPEFVEYGKQIVVYLASTPAGSKLVEALIGYIQPTAMLHAHGEPKESPLMDEQYPYVADLGAVLPPVKKPVGFSVGQLAVILLVDLLVNPTSATAEHLPLLLQAVFVLLDHYVSLVNEQAREMLVHLIHELVLSASPAAGAANAQTLAFIERIRLRDKQTTWSYDDLYSDLTTMRTPRNMDTMIKWVLRIFAEPHPGLREQWSKIALTWATTCPVRHFACRSFQIFRSSFVAVDQNMLADMFVRLSNTVADSNPDIQSFAMQILMTMNAIATELDPAELVKFPQLFWATIASAQTVHEQEFIEVLSILETLVGKLDLNDPDVVSLLMHVFPPKWEGRFDGLQKNVLPGLRSCNSYEQTLRVLDALDALDANQIVADESRLLYAVLANTPRFLHALQTGDMAGDVVQAAERLAALADQQGLPGLSWILTSVARGRFRIKDDFIRQLVSGLQSTLFVDNEANVLVFLLGLLANRIEHVRIETMVLLRYLFKSFDMRKPEFVSVGADLISPLLRLLQTEYAEQALQVLDMATYIPGTQMDKHVLRMSLGSRSVKKEYERTATVFGIPEDSGWWMPMPAVRASITRNNVHAVFYSCDVSNPEYLSLDPNNVVQFTHDEYTVGMDRSVTMTSYNAGDDADGMLSHMVATLENLDSFFTEEPTAYANVLE